MAEKRVQPLDIIDLPCDGCGRVYPADQLATGEEAGLAPALAEQVFCADCVTNREGQASVWVAGRMLLEDEVAVQTEAGDEAPQRALEAMS
jgi:hypothetical protein